MNCVYFLLFLKIIPYIQLRWNKTNEIDVFETIIELLFTTVHRN